MDFALLAGVVVFIAVVFLLAKFMVKTVIKTILLTLTILSLASIVLGLFLVYDSYKTARMLTENPVLLVSNGTKVTSGAILGNESRLLAVDELWQYSNIVTNEEKINGTYIIIADSSIMRQADGGLQMDPSESLLAYYREGKAKIYPETFTLQVIRYMPDTVLKWIESVKK
jgi:hypothetical protein